MTRPTTSPYEVNQSDLAAALDVTRSTVTQYQKEGLPFEVRGSENVYRLGVATYWATGRNFFKRRQQPARSQALTVMVGRVLTGLLHPEAPESMPQFVKQTRLFMREHFGMDAAVADRMMSQALLLAFGQ